MTAPNVYVFHSGMPGAMQIAPAGGAGVLESILYQIGVTGFGGGVLTSLTHTNGLATATLSTGLNLADGIAGMPHTIKISGSSNGWDGEYVLIGSPGTTTCTFNVNPVLPSIATGTIAITRSPAGMNRLYSSSNTSVWKFKDTAKMPGYFMLDDSQSTYSTIKLAETAANPIDYTTMVGLCPVAGTFSYQPKTNVSGTANRNWLAVIWNGGMHLFVSYNSSYQTIYDWAYYGAKITRKAGDFYPGIIMSSATQNSNSSPLNSTSASKNGSSYAGQWMQRSYSQAGSAINFLKIGTIHNNGIIGGTILTDPNPVDNANDFIYPLYLHEGSSINNSPISGFMPGTYDPINCSGKSSLDIFDNIPQLMGRKLLIMKYNLQGYVVAIDITGPY